MEEVGVFAFTTGGVVPWLCARRNLIRKQGLTASAPWRHVCGTSAAEAYSLMVSQCASISAAVGWL